MTLDEAIRHCIEVADGCSGTECKADHRQLAEWLKELKERREHIAESSKKDTISRQEALEELEDWERCYTWDEHCRESNEDYIVSPSKVIAKLPSAQPERLTDDDFETIRIHLNAYKEKLCNQHRWEEAEDYQSVINRFMAFATTQPEQRWIPCDETVEIPDHEVLACDKFGEEILGYLEYADEQWTCASEGCVMYDPIAWMEKPEPYKRGTR